MGIVKNKNINFCIDRVIAILKKEVNAYKTPSVTQMSLVGSPFKVLISCIISLRTKDEVTIVASKRLFKLADTPKEISRLNISTIEKLIYPCGFYKTKAKRIKEISKILVDVYKSNVPDTICELLKFKGVGRKTANIVVTLGFGNEGVAVDIHVHRISNRLGYVKTKTPDDTEFALRKKLPKKYWIVYNDLLVTWGQNVCKPISPFCSLCAVKQYCKRVGVEKSR